MTALIRGEIIKATTTRTILAYAAMAVVLAVAQVLVTILAKTADLTALADKKEAIAGLPMLLMLLGIVGAAGEYRHRTAAPAVLVTGRDGGVLLLARAVAYAVARRGRRGADDSHNARRRPAAPRRRAWASARHR